MPKQKLGDVDSKAKQIKFPPVDLPPPMDDGSVFVEDAVRSKEPVHSS